jgi:hypothetical protein
MNNFVVSESKITNHFIVRVQSNVDNYTGEYGRTNERDSADKMYEEAEKEYDKVELIEIVDIEIIRKHT